MQYNDGIYNLAKLKDTFLQFNRAQGVSFFFFPCKGCYFSKMPLEKSLLLRL